MNRGFWLSFIAAAVLTAGALGAVGWLVARVAAPPPRDRFLSSTFEFEIPRGWQCRREDTETVCTAGPQPYSAICVLTMKYRGRQDTFDAYAEHLSRPQTTHGSAGEEIVSEVKVVERQRIAGYWWIHGRHYQSEVAGYYTDYYATLTSHVAILITFSAHRDYIDRHRAEFETMISTLKVQQNPSAMPSKRGR